jgi:hypothetical protein
LTDLIARGTSEHRPGERVRRHADGAKNDNQAGTGEEAQKDLPRVLAKKVTPIVEREWFIYGMGILVVVNLMTIGLEVDYDDVAPGVFSGINTGMLLIYFMELCARFLTHGMQALSDTMTLVDASTVMASLFGRFYAQRSAGFVASLPTFRLLRVILFLSHTDWLRTQPELQRMTAGGLPTAKTIFWVGLALSLILCSMGSITTFTVGESSRWNDTRDPLADYDLWQRFDNREYFGSVTRSMLSLFQVVTLSEWSEIARPIMRVYPVSMAFFIFFIFATTYGLTMCVISIVVVRSIKVSKGVEQTRIEMERKQRQKLAAKAERIFARLGGNNENGYLTAAQLGEGLKDPVVQEIFSQLDVPMLDANSMVRMFDDEGTGVITHFKMMRRLVRMAEPLRQEDWALVQIRAWSLIQRARNIHGRIDAVSDKMQEAKRLLSGSIETMKHAVDRNEVTELRSRELEKIRSVPSGGKVPIRTDIAAEWQPPTQGEKAMPFFRNFVGMGTIQSWSSPTNERATSSDPRSPSAGGNYLVPSPHSHLAPPLNEALSPLRSAAYVGPHSPDHSFSEVISMSSPSVTAVCCGKAVLGEPPGPWQAQAELARTAKRENDALEDSFRQQLDGRPSPKLAHLRELMGR